MEHLTTEEKHDTLKESNLTEAQIHFLRTCQELGWGKLEVDVQAGEPVYSVLIKKTFRHK